MKGTTANAGNMLETRDREPLVTLALDVQRSADSSDPGVPETKGDPKLTIIEPRSGWQMIDLHELWRYRELLYFLAWRDIKVRYKQTVLGGAWAVLQPFATMVVFSLFVGRLSGASPDEVPYPVFVFAGLLPWFFFANSITAASQSVVGNQNLVTKIYFPRFLISLSALGVGLMDFAIGLGMLLLLMLFYGITPSIGLLFASLIFLALAVAALGLGTFLSALTVSYRDFRHVVPFMMQIWMFGTPTIYLHAETVVGPWGQWLLPLNPAYGLIFNFRAAILGDPFDYYALGVSSGVSVACFIAGCLYFRRVERNFADII